MKIKKKIKLNNSPTIWWKFDPYRFLKIYYFNNSKQIYHVVDPHLHLWQNDIQAEKSNLIICTSNKYIHYYKNKGHANVLKIPHGISKDEYDVDITKTSLIKKEYGEFVIIIGSIASDVNIKLLERIANEQINVIVIGPETIKSSEWNKIKELDNLHYLGEMHSKELKNYISVANAGLIIYNFISKQKGQVSRSPLKALNYLAQEKPVITSIDSEISDLKNEGTYWAKNENEYLKFVHQAINFELNINTHKTRKYLNQHEYPKLISTIINQLAKC